MRVPLSSSYPSILRLNFQRRLHAADLQCLQQSTISSLTTDGVLLQGRAMCKGSKVEFILFSRDASGSFLLGVGAEIRKDARESWVRSDLDLEGFTSVAPGQ